MTHDLAPRAQELRHARAAYVHARVVVAEKPTSAKPGAEAIVLADGTIEGFRRWGVCRIDGSRPGARPARLRRNAAAAHHAAARGTTARLADRAQPVPVGWHARDLPRAGHPGAAGRRRRRYSDRPGAARTGRPARPRRPALRRHAARRHRCSRDRLARPRRGTGARRRAAGRTFRTSVSWPAESEASRCWARSTCARR